MATWLLGHLDGHLDAHFDGHVDGHVDGDLRRARKARKEFCKASSQASAPVVDDASGWRGVS
jgi:hypothetical protein